MKITEMKIMAQVKCEELEMLVDVKSGNKNPDYYKTLKELKLWCIIQALLNASYDREDEMYLNETIETYFKELAQGIKRGTVIEVHEGDNALELLDKYKDVKDVWNKLKKACDDAGLKIVGSNVVKA